MSGCNVSTCRRLIQRLYIACFKMPVVDGRTGAVLRLKGALLARTGRHSYDASSLMRTMWLLACPTGHAERGHTARERADDLVLDLEQRNLFQQPCGIRFGCPVQTGSLFAVHDGFWSIRRYSLAPSAGGRKHMYRRMCSSGVNRSQRKSPCEHVPNECVNYIEHISGRSAARHQ